MSFLTHPATCICRDTMLLLDRRQQYTMKYDAKGAVQRTVEYRAECRPSRLTPSACDSRRPGPHRSGACRPASAMAYTDLVNPKGRNWFATGAKLLRCKTFVFSSDGL